jgi:hypothetical protein
MARLGYDTLVDELAVRWGLGGCVKHEQTVHVNLFVPQKGPVFADQFVEWVLLANNLNPNSTSARQRRQKQVLRAAFVKHMGAETVDASRLSWDEYERETRGYGDAGPA